MYPTISVLVPLHNAEKTIGATLQSITEIVEDLHPSFEILLVDDGSSDETAQTLVELARQYPQVSAISSRTRRGFVQAVQAGLDLLTGDVVFIQDGDAIPSPEAYRSLWHKRDEELSGVSPASASESQADHRWLGRLVEWGVQISGGICRADVPSGLQMIRRRGRLPMRAVAIDSSGRRLWRTDHAASPLWGMPDVLTSNTPARA